MSGTSKVPDESELLLLSLLQRKVLRFAEVKCLLKDTYLMVREVRSAGPSPLRFTASPLRP